MAQIFFQANILSDEISFNAQLHIYQPISASCFPMTRNCDLSLKTFLPCLQLIVIVYQKANCYPVQCNTEWPEWSKQSLYNTPVTLMVGQLCDTLCVKLCDNMWHCVLQCVTFRVLHSVTFCDTLWQWICVLLVTKVVGNLWHCSPSPLCPSTTVMFNYLMRHNRQRLIWARPTCAVRPVFTDVLWLTGYQ